MTVDRRVAHSRDDMGVRDDVAGCRHPAGSLDPEPAGVSDHAHHASRRHPDVGIAQQRWIAGTDVELRSGECREGIDTRQNVDETGRWNGTGQRARDVRALDGTAEPTVAGRVEEDRADEPDEHDAACRSQNRAADVVERAEEADPEQLPHGPARGYRKPLPDTRAHDRPRERYERGVDGRLVAQDVWGELGAHIGAHSEPHRGSRPRRRDPCESH